MARPKLCDCGDCARCKHRAYMLDWYRKNREKACETARRTRQRNLETFRARDRERGYRPGDPTKVEARRAVTAAIKRGDLVRQPCEVCGEPKTHAHHEDYLRPLDVRWLCPRHHGEEHRQIAA